MYQHQASIPQPVPVPLLSKRNQPGSPWKLKLQHRRPETPELGMVPTFVPILVQLATARLMANPISGNDSTSRTSYQPAVVVASARTTTGWKWEFHPPLGVGGLVIRTRVWGLICRRGVRSDMIFIHSFVRPSSVSCRRLALSCGVLHEWSRVVGRECHVQQWLY